MVFMKHKTLVIVRRKGGRKVTGIRGIGNALTSLVLSGHRSVLEIIILERFET